MLPSAGRHFTPELLRRLTELGVAVAEVTLDIGVKWGVVRLATWLRETAGVTEPLLPEGTARTPADERGNFPGAEHYDVPIETADTINARRRAGGRVVVCGTTVMRTLETVTDDTGRVWPGHGWTRLIIAPDHRFRSCDAFTTNLHMRRVIMSDLNKADLYGASLTGLAWHESSYSKDSKDCVEIAELNGGAVAVRDSKNPQLTALRFIATEWEAFLKGVHKGEFGA